MMDESRSCYAISKALSALPTPVDHFKKAFIKCKQVYYPSHRSFPFRKFEYVKTLNSSHTSVMNTKEYSVKTVVVGQGFVGRLWP